MGEDRPRLRYHYTTCSACHAQSSVESDLRLSASPVICTGCARVMLAVNWSPAPISAENISTGIGELELYVNNFGRSGC